MKIPPGWYKLRSKTKKNGDCYEWHGRWVEVKYARIHSEMPISGIYIRRLKTIKTK